MGKRLLPCPVCGGESFIESVTQGGLICTDCGAVSNQVEVADDEMDPQAAPKTFMRGTSYKHVTEEESQAKRDRKVNLSLVDRRDVPTLLEGLGMMVAHMAEASAALELCPGDVRGTIKEAWIEFLKLVAGKTDSPTILGKTTSSRLAINLAKWGISEDFGDSVTRDLPVERLKRIQSLHPMMQERRLGTVRDVYNEPPFLIFAHDWLCLFFQTNEFPFPDWILVHFSGQPVSWSEVERIRRLTPNGSRVPFLPKNDRKAFIRKLFVDIVSSDEIRRRFFAENKKIVPDEPFVTVPGVDLTTALAVLIIGIRRAGGAAEPIHILNWIARNQIPFFSAHKCLPQSIDRIEYYRIPRTAHAYRKSVFAPTSAVPSARELSDVLQSLATLGMDVPANDPLPLMRAGLDMLGLRALEPLTECVLGGAIERIMKGRNCRTFKPRSTAKYNPSTTDFMISDVIPEELVHFSIVVAMKLVFPALHERTAQSNVGQDHFDLVTEAVRACPLYTIMSGRKLKSFGEVEWWNALTGDEKEHFLLYVEGEHLNELREGLVDDLRGMLAPPAVSTQGVSAVSVPTVLTPGPVVGYEVTPAKLAADSPLLRVIQDVKFELQLDAGRSLVRGVRYFERFFFRRADSHEVHRKSISAS